jgi:hypothetical protein
VKEALWIQFESQEQFAIKLFVGGVNAISGSPAGAPQSQHRLQDYVVTPRQRWLDGIATSAGEVRQFVAVPMGRGFSIEAQVTQQEKYGGIQIEVMKRKKKYREFNLLANDGRSAKLRLEVGESTGQLRTAISEALPPQSFQAKLLDNDITIDDTKLSDLSEKLVGHVVHAVVRSLSVVCRACTKYMCRLKCSSGTSSTREEESAARELYKSLSRWIVGHIPVG